MTIVQYFKKVTKWFFDSSLLYSIKLNNVIWFQTKSLILPFNLKNLKIISFRPTSPFYWLKAQVLFPTFKVLLDKIKSGNKEIRISIFSPFVCLLDSIPPLFLDNHFIINLSPLFITIFIFIACKIFSWAFGEASASYKSIFL